MEPGANKTHSISSENDVLGSDHPTTRACHQHYTDAVALQEKGQLAISLAMADTIADSRASARIGKGSKLLSGLANMGIGSSKWSARWKQNIL